MRSYIFLYIISRSKDCANCKTEEICFSLSTLHQATPTVGNKIFYGLQPFAHFYSLKGRMYMKTLSLRRTLFLALGIMVAILVVLTTSVFGMN